MILLYLDPVTGSLLIQFIIAAVSGILLFFNRIKLGVKNLYTRFFEKKQEGEMNETD